MKCGTCGVDCTDYYFALANDRRPECPKCFYARERRERKAEQRKADAFFAKVEANYREWLHA